ncbi:MAG: Blue-light-activated protein [Luteibacter sp.]|uniref:hybrid sensor histidine kinase/response regulator n=1 Tax=Luteibacter sp. TaxID=1886636 RepID=UPI0013819A97|nr:response regulator [Luteibacter sp.]KAF1006314.1 MAG: Blue-light-activated protein [Luteibacter sp.]
MSVTPIDPTWFLPADRELGRLIRDMDWRASSLGPMDTWPDALRHVLATMLRTEAPMALFQGPEGVLFYNDAYRAIAGLRHPSVLGQPVTLGWPEVADFNRQVLATVFAGGTLSFRDQHVMLNRTGEPEDVWLHLDYSPLMNDDGKVGGVVVLIKETTHRVEVEQRLRIAQQAGGVGTFEWFPETGRLEVSDEYRRIWGLPAQGPVTDTMLYMMLHPDDRSSAAMNRMEQGNPLDYVEYRRVDPVTGEIRWIARRGEVVRHEGRARRRYIGIAMDITHRKAAEDALRASEQRWRTLFEQMHEGFVMGRALRNEAGRVTDFVMTELNPAFERQTGIPTADADGRRVREVIPDIDDAIIERYARLLDEGGSTEFEVNVPALGGRWFESRARAIGDDRFAALFVDISDRKKAEAALADLASTLQERVTQRTAELLRTQDALRQSQKMEAIGNLTGGVAHDFNNLLQVISGNLQLLAEDTAGNDRASRRVSNAMAGVTRGSKLAAQLLAFGRRQPLAPKVVNIGRFIRDMDDLLRRTLGEAIEIETIIAGGLWNTLIDPGNIENALLNLAINARDAMDGQGRLTIEAGNAYLDANYVDALDDVSAGQYVLLAVTDTGHGIDADIVDKVFDPFFTTKPEGRGTGLGLSMVYGFVKQSGGHIRIYSEAGHGTTVKLYMPRTTQTEDVIVDIDVGPVTGGSETILVAEDDDAVRETVVAMLADLGYRVLKARDASSALSIVDSGIPIDLLFTDVVMPGTLKSTELARKACERLPGMAVVFTSGYTENSIVHGGRLDEGVELLSKPYTRESLARKLRQVFAAQAQRNAAQPMTVPSITPPAHRKVRILVVEDDWLVRTTVVEMLQLRGHEVYEAGDANQAFDVLERQAIDLLIADVGLPGMSGVELATQARGRRESLAVIFATGHANVASVQADSRTVVLGKPYGSDALAGAIARLFPARGTS